MKPIWEANTPQIKEGHGKMHTKHQTRDIKYLLYK